MSEHTCDPIAELDRVNTTDQAERPGRPTGERHDDAGFVVSEGLAYAVVFIGVMGAIGAVFTNLGPQIVTNLLNGL